MIKQDNKVFGTTTKAPTLTQSAYNALSTSEKNNGSGYLVSSSEEEFQKLLYSLGLIGRQNALANIADGTVAGAIVDLYSKLGGCQFDLESIAGVMSVTHEASSPSGNTPVDISELTTDEDKIDALYALVGDRAVLQSTGNGSIVDAILDLYERLNGFSFAVDTSGQDPVLSLTRVI